MVWVVQMARAMFDRCALVVHRPLAEGQKEASANGDGRMCWKAGRGPARRGARSQCMHTLTRPYVRLLLNGREIATKTAGSRRAIPDRIQCALPAR
jgi:hypothetical protein